MYHVCGLSYKKNMREFKVDPDHGPSRTKPKTGIITEIKEKTFVH